MFRFLGVSLAFALVTSLNACIDPKDQRPGVRLRGEVVREIPSDWTFSNDYREIAIEVRTPYLIPHSVTVWCAATEQQLYVAARNPQTKRWPRWVERDADARLRIGERIYEVKLAVVADPGEVAEVRRAYAAKYDLPDPAPEAGPPLRYWRVEPRS